MQARPRGAAPSYLSPSQDGLRWALAQGLAQWGWAGAQNFALPAAERPCLQGLLPARCCPTRLGRVPGEGSRSPWSSTLGLTPASPPVSVRVTGGCLRHVRFYEISSPEPTVRKLLKDVLQQNECENPRRGSRGLGK